MIYLVVALRAEAKPLLEHWSFKRNRSVPQRLYEREGMALLVTQMGRGNAAAALEAVLARENPKAEDLLINFGLCAAPSSHPPGSAVSAGELRCKGRSVPLRVPDIENVAQMVLETVDEPFRGRCDHAVDMEACGIYSCAQNYFKPGRIAFFKVVSDHFTPEGFDREEAVGHLGESIPLLEKLIVMMKGETDG